MNFNLAAERAYSTPLGYSALLPLLLISLAKQKHTPDVTNKFRKEYDYIVVGGGTAGSVVAARLSEVPCVNVLLLEAGGSPPKLTEVPGIGRSFWFSDIDWNRKTAPQKHTGYGLVNNQVSWPSGKVLGGSSILSVGFHVTGNRKDYDGWAAMGAKGWSYRDVLPFFKKLEDNRIPKYATNGFHGVGGPVTVEIPRYVSDVKRAVFHAAKSVGYEVVDPNAKRQTGYFLPQTHLRSNVRCSTAKAYLVPAENRKNLDILPNAFVKKVLINNGRATGVLFDFKGKSHTVRAKREVVLSSGTVNSAQLLMLSGIGPKEELQRFNIPVHADLPVGRNFQDHVATTLDFVLNPHIRPFVDKLQDPESIKSFVHNRTGPLASTIGISVMAFLLNNEIKPKLDFPNIGLHYMEGTLTGSAEERNLKPEVYQQVFGPYERHAKLSCIVSTTRPRSRGVVALKSANPYVPPVIDPNYFADPKDLEEIVRGMKACKGVALSPIMKEIGTRPFQTLYPGCEKYVNNEDAYFRCQAQSVIYTLSHPVGTSKMGDPRDPTTVVDPKLRVKNIRGLRVIDNSIMPTITSGNTELPAIMIGEKGSALIKESIKCRPQEMENREIYYDDQQGSHGYIYPLPPRGYDSDRNEYDEELNYSHEDDDIYESDRTPYGRYDKDRRIRMYDSELHEDYKPARNTFPEKMGYEDNYPLSERRNFPFSAFEEHKTVDPVWSGRVRGY